MGNKVRWLVWVMPLVFLGVIAWAIANRDPDFWRSPPSLYRLAREAAAHGDPGRARDLARKAWARDPQNSAYGTFLGRLYLEAGQPQEALELSRRLLAQNPEAPALTLQAQALDRLGERQEALDLLAGYLKDHPENTEVLETAAVIASRQTEDQPLAIIYYRKLYQLGQAPPARRRLLELLVAAQRYQEAIPLQEEEVAQFPENQEALHRLALLYYWQRDYQAATQIYQRLLEQGAGDAALRREAAKNADAAHATDQALAHYLWLYGHDQGKKEYAVALARLWDQKGNHAEAAGILAPLMQEYPEPELRRWYGLELLLIGDFTKAQKEYQAAWEAGDTHQETIINLARLNAKNRQFAKAAALWDEAQRRQVLKGELRWEAGLTYSYARRYQDALEVMGPLRQQHPRDPKLLLFSGQLNFYQEHWEQAAHFFTAYLEVNPQDAEVRRQLAEALSFKPETRPQAIQQYGQVLKVKNEGALRLRRISLLLEERRWDEAAKELQDCPRPEDPRLIKEEAHLFLWLGNLDEALKLYDLFLKKAPQDRAGRLEKARVLTYLGRGSEALELLNRLRLEQPQDQVVRVAAIEAYLGVRDFPKALILAQKELEPRPDLSLEERALVARCYYHSTDPKHCRLAVDLLVGNLQKNRHHHPSLLILAALLPRLPRYEDLDRVLDVLPGSGVGGSQSASSLAYFDGILGRQGGKLAYLLHLMQESRRHKLPDSPGELLGLAWLAMELDDKQAAMGYYQAALKIRPHDQSIVKLLLQCQLAQKRWGLALTTLETRGPDPGNAMEMAHLYMLRGQYEGVKAMVARIPEDSPDRIPGLFLLAQAYRSENVYPEALKTLAQIDGKVPRQEWLMEKARTLEAMGDRGAVELYDEIIAGQPDSQAARVAQARRARARGNWGAAYKDYAQALKATPQDVELLNELESVRQQMRPEMASRGFPNSRGERRPEEAQRPWQFSGFGREPHGLGLTNYLPGFISDVLPIVQPETLYAIDSNRLSGFIVRLSGAFWITKVLPARLGVEYRQYNQNSESVKLGPVDLGLFQVYNQQTGASSRLRRAEVSLGLGPLSIDDRLKISGEVILRRYWKRVDHHILQTGQQLVQITFPIPHFLYFNTNRTYDFTTTDDQNRFLGTLELSGAVGRRTEATLRYSRRDIFDQDPYLFPRIYQSVLKLAEVPTLTYHQVDLSYNHQFRPGLDWRGTVGGAFYSDDNRRLTLYQGLAWQAISEPRMHLGLTPHYYFATYEQRHPAYFSPNAYHAFGLGLDFDRQIFRLPTLILQGTAQAVNQHGDWGPALQGLAALEWEFVQNFFADLHAFYFREWVDNYRVFTAGVSFRYRF